MGILFALFAALLASTCNLCLRLSIGSGGTSRGYLVVQLSCSFLAMIALNPVRTGDYGWSTAAVVLGLIGGLIYGLFMWGLGKTLEKGPPGLSLAILNTSSVMPAVVLALLFGTLYGHPYTASNAIGSILVVVGILWAGWTSEKNPNKATWAIFATFIFFMHTLFLVYLQWWAMVLQSDLGLSKLLPFHIQTEHIQWFMPALFLGAAIVQWCVYLSKGTHLPRGSEVTYGILGGITNGACTFFLILAPQVATAWENAMLFPVFSVGVILVCNTWARMIYKEEVNWRANALCGVGILIGTIAWGSI